MAIRDESTSTAEILRDARFHRAAVAADPKTQDLAEHMQKAMAKLREARDAREQAEDARTDHLAVLLRTDFELDERLRLLELQVLGAVGKDRQDVRYRSVFPKGLSGLVALRGEDEGRAVKDLVKALNKHLAKVAREHEKELERLAHATLQAEQKWKEAEQGVATAVGQEVIARLVLVRQLQKNEGALLSVFPGQKRRVRSFFRPTRRRGAAPDSGAPEVDAEASGQPG